MANTTGANNNAVGASTLATNSTGGSNNALSFNTTGSRNNAFGGSALFFNTTGGSNDAYGNNAQRANTTGSNNSAFGMGALASNTTGLSNIRVGFGALKRSVGGNDNIALEFNAGSLPVTGANNIYIGHTGVGGETRLIRIGRQGTQLKTFVAGIHGTTVNGAAVLVNSAGQLGVLSSSRRFKRRYCADGRGRCGFIEAETSALQIQGSRRTRAATAAIRTHR